MSALIYQYGRDVANQIADILVQDTFGFTPEALDPCHGKWSVEDIQSRFSRGNYGLFLTGIVSSNIGPTTRLIKAIRAMDRNGIGRPTIVFCSTQSPHVNQMRRFMEMNPTIIDGSVHISPGWEDALAEIFERVYSVKV